MSELPFYYDTRVVINNRQVVFDGITYSLAGISSAELAAAPADRKNGLALLVAGGFCFLIAMVPLLLIIFSVSNYSAMVFPFIFIALTLLLSVVLLNAGRLNYSGSRFRYRLILNYKGNRLEVLSSKDPVYLGSVSKEVNRAITR